MNPTLRALNGFGLGARPGETARLVDPRRWLHAQLEGSPPHVSPPDAASPARIVEALGSQRAIASASERERREARRALAAVVTADAVAALSQRVASDRPFVERLVAFWSNHLCVSAASKLPVRLLAGSYEREVIRPHVLGRFEEMVLASAKHPAMLLYLDNAQSIGPASPAGQIGARRAPGGRRPGLNENYARELLELHTLGVDGGYTQQDVTELARVLTGWTVSGLPGRAGPAMRPPRGARSDDERSGNVGFVFRPQLHEPGAKTVLGRRYASASQSDGENAIRALCRHPATARFVATKLVRHFVADEPPQSAIDRIASVFMDTGGDLRQVSAALADLPDAWRDGARKFRTPQDWLVAVLRAFGAQGTDVVVTNLLRQLRQPLWAPQSPKGFGDSTGEWADPDALMNRAELARSIARRLGRTAFDPRTLIETMDVVPNDPVVTILSDTAIPAPERVALAIAGPAFQWR